MSIPTLGWTQFGNLFTAPVAERRRRGLACPAPAETLEQRILLSGTTAPFLGQAGIADAEFSPSKSGPAVVAGTGAHDRISITRVTATTATVQVRSYQTAAQNDADLISDQTYTIDTSGGVRVEAGGGDDEICVDARLTTRVTVWGGVGTDRLSIDGHGLTAGVYTPDAALFGTSMSYGGRLTFTGGMTLAFEKFDTNSTVQVTDLVNVKLVTPNAGDAITLGSAEGGIGTVFGSSGGVGFAALHYRNVVNLNIDAALNGGGPDTDAVFVDTGHFADGVSSVAVLTGVGDDRFEVRRRVDPRSFGGRVTFNGGVGQDRLDYSGLSPSHTVQLAGVNTGGFSGTAGLWAIFHGIDEYLGNASGDTLVGLNQVNHWNLISDRITGLPASTYATAGGVLNFRAVSTIEGGSAGDVFFIRQSSNNKLRGNGGNDLFLFSRTPYGQPGDIGGYGDAVFLSTQRINGGDGADTLGIDDRAYAGGGIYHVFADEIRTNRDFRLRFLAGIENLNLQTGTGNDGVALFGWGGQVSLTTGDGDDRVHLAEGNVGTLAGQFGISTGVGNDVMVVDDRQNTANRTFDLSATGLNTSAGLNASLVAVESMTLYGGGGNDGFGLFGWNGTLNVVAGAGYDRMILGHFGSLAGFRGAVLLNGGTGTDVVALDDRANGFGTTFHIRDNSLLSSSGLRITALTDVEILSLQAGSGNDGIGIFGWAGSLGVAAGGGDDFVLLGEGNLDTLTGQYYVDGGAGRDQLRFDDTGRNTGSIYRMNGTAVTSFNFNDLGANRPFRGATYAAVESVAVVAEGASDRFEVKPDATVAFQVFGGFPPDGPPQGDGLVIDFTDVTNPVLTENGGTGAWTFGNRARIDFAGIEGRNVPPPVASPPSSSERRSIQGLDLAFADDLLLV